MTLQQMRYAVIIAEKGSFGKAANVLFISQPSLSNAIRDLEAELGISIFIRTQRGAKVSPQGHAFIEAAKRIVSLSDHLLHQYADNPEEQPINFSVSSLPYAFASRAFSKFLCEMKESGYELCFRDAQLLQVIQDVSAQRSEIGILDISPKDRTALELLLKRSDLEYFPLYTATPHALVRVGHPLADRRSLTMADLEPYPFVLYELEPADTLDYFNETVLTKYAPRKRLQGKDRSTLITMIRSTDGFSISNGLLDPEIYSGLTAIALTNISDCMEIGWICQRGSELSQQAKQYLSFLKREIQLLAPAK